MNKIKILQKDISEFSFKKYYKLNIYNLLDEFNGDYNVVIIKDDDNKLDEYNILRNESKQYRIISDFYTKSTKLIDVDSLHDKYMFISNSLIVNKEFSVMISDYEAEQLELIKLPKVGLTLLLEPGDRVIIDVNNIKTLKHLNLKYYQSKDGYYQVIDILKSIEDNRMSKEYLNNFLGEV